MHEVFHPDWLIFIHYTKRWTNLHWERAILSQQWHWHCNLIGQYDPVYKSIDNAACINVSCNAFINSQAWMTWKFWRQYLVKNKSVVIKHGQHSYWQQYLVITVVKICWGLTHLVSPQHFDHCTDHTKPLLIC